jgi:hypothetical protein
MAAFNLLGYSLLWNRPMRHEVFIAAAAVHTVLIGTGFIVLTFYWQGRNWARILVILDSLVALYNLHDLKRLKSSIYLVQFMILGEAILGAFLVYYLSTSEARTFFRRAPARTVASE